LLEFRNCLIVPVRVGVFSLRERRVPTGTATMRGIRRDATRSIQRPADDDRDREKKCRDENRRRPTIPVLELQLEVVRDGVRMSITR
jgi:hypothetical protein